MKKSLTKKVVIIVTVLTILSLTLNCSLLRAQVKPEAVSIIKDVLPWIERAEWEDFWVIPNREEAIRTALIWANKNDVILIAWKGDEHVLMTNAWPIQWHDKTKVLEILKEIDDNKIIK